DEDIDMPRHDDSSDQADPHSQRLRHVCETDRTPPTAQQVRNARRAYYGAISYVDDQFGAILEALEQAGLAKDTIIVVTSDHGE
ncbi:choline-sulfatase, partial [Mesorhizobium sp. M2D.F.Ca.ET.140.01.1.1]